MKTALLVCDITNQYYSILHALGSVKIDYEKYLTSATKGYNIYRALAYGAQAKDEASGFITVLSNLGFEPRYRKAITIGRRVNIRQTDRNMMIAMDVWRIIDKVDVVIIGSNDPDLAPLVQRIKELGIQVVIHSYNISDELKAVADRWYEIDFSIMGMSREVADPA